MSVSFSDQHDQSSAVLRGQPTLNWEKLQTKLLSSACRLSSCFAGEDPTDSALCYSLTSAAKQSADLPTWKRSLVAPSAPRPALGRQRRWVFRCHRQSSLLCFSTEHLAASRDWPLCQTRARPRREWQPCWAEVRCTTRCWTMFSSISCCHRQTRLGGGYVPWRWWEA